MIRQTRRKRLGSHAGSKVRWRGPRGARDGQSWPQDGPKRAPRIILTLFAVARRPFLGPSWAILGPLGPLLGDPGGHLEAKFGLGRLDLGVQGGPKLRCQKHQTI